MPNNDSTKFMMDKFLKNRTSQSKAKELTADPQPFPENLTPDMAEIMRNCLSMESDKPKIKG